MTLLVPLLMLICISKTSSVSPYSTQKEFSRTNKEFQTSKIIDNQNLFSPRMDYDEWTPLGRGDPLKNDPTYDYVPPVLDKVHYWMDPSKRTPDPPQRNSGLLVLRTEPTFTTRPTTPRYQVFQSKESQADSRIDTSSLLDPFFKLMDVSQFNLNFNANNQYKPVPNRIQRPHHSNVKPRTPQPPQALQRPPYRVLMPPPPPPPPHPMPSQPVTNLITSHATTVTEKIQTQETTMTTPVPTTTTMIPNTTMINTTILANTENVFKPVAISMPGLVEPFVNDSIKATTETSMVLPIVTMFDHYKKHTNEVKKQQQSNQNHLQRQTTPKHKPLKVHNQNKPQNQAPWRGDTRVSTYESTLRATTAPPVTTTAKYHSMTTDPMFKHYKQPLEPVKGPFYLIIQGHSKVKTYGASKNPVHKLLTSNEIKYDEEEDRKRGVEKFDRRSRRLSYDTIPDEGNNVDESNDPEEVRNISFRDNLESLEETFPKSKGGSSKKRYLGSNHRRKRSSEPDNTAEERKATEKPDNLDLESLIAINDDYDPENVANILLKQEGSEGSGLGNFALSIFSRSDTDGQEV